MKRIFLDIIVQSSSKISYQISFFLLYNIHSNNKQLQCEKTKYYEETCSARASWKSCLKNKRNYRNMSRYEKLMVQMAGLLPKTAQTAFLHPAGPTTVFFWAPTFKWGLVIAGLGDINRPPQTISLAQTASLMLTGAVWSRYSLVIIPKNWNLFSVNIFVCMTGAYNFYRGLIYQMEQK